MSSKINLKFNVTMDVESKLNDNGNFNGNKEHQISHKLSTKIEEEIPLCCCGCNCCSNCRKYFVIDFCHRRPFLTCLLVFLVIAAICVFFIVTCGPCILPASYSSKVRYKHSENTQKYQGDTAFNVILFGDSLVSYPSSQFGLLGKMKDLLPDFNLNIMNYGENGDTILDMRARLPSVIDTPADAVILLWDSDIAAVDERKLSSYAVAELRNDYTTNLKYVINSIKVNKPSAFIAISGPLLLGEGTLFMIVSLSDYLEKIRMLNDYRLINEQVAASFNITYIDLRHSFVSLLPDNRLAYQGCLTVDGEHQNENGAVVVAKYLSRQLARWLESGQ